MSIAQRADGEISADESHSDDYNIVEFLSEKSQNRDTTALIVLNCPIAHLGSFQKIYDNAKYCICADAGADRLYNLAISSVEESSNEEARRRALERLLPHAVHGDLDSVTDDVVENYKSLGVTVTQDPDQESTDCGKAVAEVIQQLPSVRNILVSGSLGGRVDQGIGILHEFFREQTKRSGVKFWLFSEQSVTVLLRAGTTVIKTPVSSGLIARDAGILPVYGKAVISTKGFEWDVKDWVTEMGGRVSTSNHIVADQVEIATNVSVLFTVATRTS